MNRIFNITVNNLNQSKTQQNIDVSNLSSVVNNSADSITFYCLQHLDQDSIIETINQIFNKIKPSGIINLKILDTKKYAYDFANSTVSGKDFLEKIDQFKNMISLDDIYGMVDANFKIIQIKKDNNYIFISMQRVGI
jgi:hypothetical protein